MKLELIKSAKFGEVQADIYKSDDEPYMTAEQLGNCLGYSHPRENVNKLVQRNAYLKGKEFSAEVKMTSPRGDTQKTRVFNEDGIYEVTMLAKTAKAQEFRAWIRRILKSLRRGDTKLISMTEYQRLTMQKRVENAKIRKAQILTRLAAQYEGTTYQQVLNSYATKELTGEHLLPLPQLPDKTYTATELGEMFGVSANRIGIITNRHNLKTAEYGAWFNDKAKGHNKEIQSFRYYPNIIPVLRELLKDIA